MATISGSSTAEIDAPIGQVWELVEEVEKAPDWQGGLKARLMPGRCRGIALVGCALAALVASMPASARIVNATSILPPGESGYVSLLGVASGTGSPHDYDQQQPFINFTRKSAMFGQPG